MHLRSLITFLLSFLMLASCASFPNQENFNQKMSSYKGISIDDFVKKWGAPKASHVNSDNTRVYQWTQGGASMHFPGASYPWIGAQSNGYAPWNHALFPAWGGGVFNSGINMIVSRPMILDRSCILNITTDPKNIVTGFNSIGAGCVL